MKEFKARGETNYRQILCIEASVFPSRFSFLGSQSISFLREGEKKSSIHMCLFTLELPRNLNPMRIRKL